MQSLVKLYIYIYSRDLIVCVKWFAERLLPTQSFRGGRYALDDHRAHCSSHCRLLLKIMLLSFVYKATVVLPYSLWLSAFFWGGPSQSYFKNEAADCNVTVCRMASLIGFAWRKFCIRECLSKCFWVNRYLAFQPPPSAWIFVLHFWFKRNYNFYGNSTSKCGCGVCTLYFSKQISKSVTYLARTFINTLEYESITANTENVFN